MKNTVYFKQNNEQFENYIAELEEGANDEKKIFRFKCVLNAEVETGLQIDRSNGYREASLTAK